MKINIFVKIWLYNWNQPKIWVNMVYKEYIKNQKNFKTFLMIIWSFIFPFFHQNDLKSPIFIEIEYFKNLKCSKFYSAQYGKNGFQKHFVFFLKIVKKAFSVFQVKKKNDKIFLISVFTILYRIKFRTYWVFEKFDFDLN